MNRPVTDWFGQYLACSQLADSSKRIKSRACRYFVDFAGDRPPDTVEYGLAEDFRNWLAKRLGRGVNCYIRNFKPFWQWLQRRRIIEQNPFDCIRELSFEQFCGENFTPTEIERMLRVAEPLWQLIVAFGFLGLRRAETLNLTLEDVDVPKGCLYVRGKKETATTWAWSIKNHTRRIVPLPATIGLPDMVLNLHAAIAEVKAVLPANQMYLCLKPQLHQRRIQQHRAGVLTAELRNCPWQNFDREFVRLQRRAAVRPRRYQDLRATFGTTMASYLPLKATQTLMGHRNYQTTNNYYVRVEQNRLLDTSRAMLANCYGSNET